MRSRYRKGQKVIAQRKAGERLRKLYNATPADAHRWFTIGGIPIYELSEMQRKWWSRQG